VEGANLRDALEWSAACGNYELLARLAAPLTPYVWIRKGQLDVGRRWVELAMAHLDGFEPWVAASVVDAARALAWNGGQTQLATELAERALVMWRELGNLEGECVAMMFRDTAALEHGDFASSRAILTDVVAFAREHKLRVLPTVLVNLSDIAIAEGDLEAARELCDEALSTSDGPESPDGTVALINLTEIANSEGRPGDGAAFAHQAVVGAWNRGDVLFAVWATIVTAWSLAELGELERAGHLLGAANGFLSDAGANRQRTELVSEERVLRALAARFDDQQIQALLAQGRELPIETAILDAARGPQYSSGLLIHSASVGSSARPLAVRSSTP
jgi:non-specific serine/threonine protein kinase